MDALNKEPGILKDDSSENHILSAEEEAAGVVEPAMERGDPPLINSCNDEQAGEDTTNNNSEHHASQMTSSDRQDSVFRDAVAASTALMGETILDSPTGALRAIRPDRSSWGTPPRRSSAPNDNPIPHAPSLTTIASGGNSNSQEAVSVGIMAQGLAWARRQKDRRQRLYLQHQAEQQLRKIRQAQEEESAAAPTTEPAAGGRSLLDNPTFQNIMHLAHTTTKTPSDDSIHYSSSDDNIGGCMDGGGGGDSEDEDSIDVSKNISKSGDGYSVELLDVVEQQQQQPSTIEEDASWIPPVRVEDPGDSDDEGDDDNQDGSSSSHSNPFLLDKDVMQQIAIHVLPRGIAYCRWKRVYSLVRDGDSFDACLRNVANQKHTLLVVRTTRNQVFGGFADAPWAHPTKQFGGARYYGGPGACLFRVLESNEEEQQPSNDSPAPTQEVVSPSSPRKRIKWYPWTGANRYIQLCDVQNKMLAFGGGGQEGAFGLCVMQDFQRGSTGTCATFQNEPLCQPENFDILNMEIYGFLIGQF